MNAVLRRTARLAGAFALTACLWPAAQAGQISATASQNTVGLVSNPSSGSTTSAAWPDALAPLAEAEVSRTSIAAASYQRFLPVQQLLAASGTVQTNYQLWDLGTGAALDGGVASGLSLNFEFRLIGDFGLPRQGLSTASVSYDANLYSDGVSSTSDGLSGVYGPVPPFPTEDYSYTGNQALIGHYDLSFSLLHQHAAGGLWTMGLATSASNWGSSTAQLGLSSITFAAGSPIVQGLAVRLETGELIAVSAVPEPATWAMALAGAATLLLRRRFATA